QTLHRLSTLALLEHPILGPATWTVSSTPRPRLRSSVDLPCKPPPTTRLTPSGTPMPATHPRLGSSTSVRNDGGAVNVTTSSSASARSSTPLRRGSTEPSATNATSPRSSRESRRAVESSTVETNSRTASWSSSCHSRLAYIAAGSTLITIRYAVLQSLSLPF